MCHDIAFHQKIQKIIGLFPEVVFDQEFIMQFAPSHIIGHAYPAHPILYTNTEDHKTHCDLMEWGCIPFFVKDELNFKKQRASMLNARAERIFADTTSYWNKIRNRRCLVPVTGFYEHRAVPGFKNKIPYFICLKDKPIFYLPALYSVAQLPDMETGELIQRKTFVIVTTEANRIMQQIHNSGTNTGRMPLMLTDDNCKEWIDEASSEMEIKELLNFQMPDAALNWHPVFSIRTAKQREDGKEKYEFYDWPGLETLV